jgi:hypothetical protein
VGSKDKNYINFKFIVLLLTLQQFCVCILSHHAFWILKETLAGDNASAPLSSPPPLFFFFNFNESKVLFTFILDFTSWLLWINQ